MPTQQGDAMLNSIRISLTILSLSIASSAIVHAEPAPAPREAVAVINAVHAASNESDYARLQTLMANEFLWSFGGDRDAAQAIEAWKSDLRMMKRLSTLTVNAEKCGFVTPEYVQCPAELTEGWRVGFMSTSNGWRMSYFVAGD